MNNIFKETLEARKEEAQKEACVLTGVIAYTNTVFNPKKVANKVTGEEYFKYDISFLISEKHESNISKLNKLLCDTRDDAIASGYFKSDTPVSFPLNSCKNMKKVKEFDFDGFYRGFASTFNKPNVVGRNLDAIVDGDLLHAGSKINIELWAKPQKYTDKVGNEVQSVNLGFGNVQIVDYESLVIPVTTRNAPEDVFSKID